MLSIFLVLCNILCFIIHQIILCIGYLINKAKKITQSFIYQKNFLDLYPEYLFT